MRHRYCQYLSRRQSCRICSFVLKSVILPPSWQANKHPLQKKTANSPVQQKLIVMGGCEMCLSKKHPCTPTPEQEPESFHCGTSNVVSGSENAAIRTSLQGKASGASGTICRISNIKTDGRWEAGKHRLNSRVFCCWETRNFLLGTEYSSWLKNLVTGE